jgi:hypothetical protein
MDLVKDDSLALMNKLKSTVAVVVRLIQLKEKISVK